MWGRGLKYDITINDYVLDMVAPCVGAWIEIDDWNGVVLTVDVAPCVGAWIEMN